MKFRLPLRSIVLLLALTNLLVLALAALLFFRLQFRSDLNSILLSPSREKIVAVSTLIGRDLREARPEERDRILARHSAVHQVNFVLFSNEGERLAGPTVALPAEVESRLKQGNPPDRKGPPLRKGEDFDAPPPPPPGEEQPPPDRKGPPKGGKKKGNLGPGQVFLVQTATEYPYWVGVRMPAEFPESSAPLRATMLIYTNSFYSNPFFFDIRPFAVAGAFGIGLSLLIWLPFLHSLTGKLKRMSAVTEAIAAGNFRAQLPPSKSLEVHHLSESINKMSRQLDVFVEGQKRFLGDVSHELCSPIARIQFALGILENEASPAQKPHIDDLYEEVQHMSTLVNELMSFSKAGMKAKDAKLEPLELFEIVSRALGRETPPGLEFLIRIPENLYVLADRELLFRALSNVIRNAYRYAGDSGPVEVEALSEPGDSSVRIRILDSGPGLAPEHIERIFEAFYRPENARGRNTGGFGLGLAIVKSAIESCNGSVHCENRQPHGLIIEFKLPRAV